jgi:very-short-patch-repair endonuclease
MNTLPYNPNLKEKARRLRNNSTKAEIRLWIYLKGRQMMGYDFHRQKPIDNFIVDFFLQGTDAGDRAGRLHAYL